MVTNRGLAVLAIRLFALFLVVYVLAGLPELYLLTSTEAANGAGTGTLFYWFVGVAYGLPLLLSVIMWFFVGHITTRILPQRTATQHDMALLSTDVEIIGYAMVGLFLAVDALPPLTALGAQLYVSWRNDPYGELDYLGWVQLASLGGKLILGITLFFGSRGISQLMRYLRRAGTR